MSMMWEEIVNCIVLKEDQCSLVGIIWGFPKMVVPNNYAFPTEIIIWGVLRVPPFEETPICLVLNISA